MQKFLIGEGGILRVRGLISLAFVATTCLLWLTGAHVPDDLVKTTGVVLAFYFSTRAVEGVITSKDNED